MFILCTEIKLKIVSIDLTSLRFFSSLNKEVLIFHTNSVQVLARIITCVTVRKVAIARFYLTTCVSHGKIILPNHSIPAAST